MTEVFKASVFYFVIYFGLSVALIVYYLENCYLKARKFYLLSSIISGYPLMLMTMNDNESLIGCEIAWCCYTLFFIAVDCVFWYWALKYKRKYQKFVDRRITKLGGPTAGEIKALYTGYGYDPDIQNISQVKNEFERKTILKKWRKSKRMEYYDPIECVLRYRFHSKWKHSH